jgi:hypothetical protein
VRLRSLTCAKCGGRTRIEHGRASGSCMHCGSEVKVSQAVLEEQSKAWAFPPATFLRLGMKAKYSGRDYEVWGRQVFRQTDDEGVVYQWEEFVLVSPDGDLLYLEYDEGKWKISEPFVPQQPPDNAQLSIAAEGGSLHMEGHGCSVTDAGTSQLVYVQGEFPWLVAPGRIRRFVDAQHLNDFYSIEWSEDEIEYYRGRYVDERQILSMFAQTALLQELDKRLVALRSRRTFGWSCLAASLIALILWGVALAGPGVDVPGGSGSVMLNAAVGEEGQRFGPIQLTAKGSVHRLEIRGNMTQASNWVQAVLEDESEVPLLDTQRDMWDESGRDSDGPWHESDLSASTDFVLAKPGVYYIRLYAEPEPGRTAEGSAAFRIRAKVLYPVYFAIFGFSMLALGVIFLVAGNSAGESRIWDRVHQGGAE